MAKIDKTGDAAIMPLHRILDNEPEQSQESGVSDFTPETPLSDPGQPKDNKQPVQLELW